MKLKEIPVSLFHSFRLRYFKRPRRKGKTLDVLVSLTSIPSRLDTLDIVIESLLEQKQSPKLIILWLNPTLKESLPKRLKKLQSNIFKIKYCEGTSSYRKLLPSLKAYPDKIIVTCDDDMIYPKCWLENLHRGYLKHNKRVISQVGRLIESDKRSVLKPYKEWPFIRHENSSPSLLPIGYGGVLYPPLTFNEQVFDEKTFMRLSPRADDLWFKAMAYLNGTLSYCVSEKARPIPIFRSQKEALNNENIDEDKNRKQWQALCDKYPRLNEIS